ncbi:hypothetical protein E2562_026910 [Oryza meyeriana var. granulata]|uniref:Uncharacterized protein n=1 Tax=Oryza meyeriana var. granulata TaxID=110450 RepID=A0A6G1CTF9_9ORYZ|nr:hypothetical protein E2562_026910 [Oryza meyeriana var. granulata]
MRLKGKLATCEFALADKATRQAKACEDPTEKRHMEKALWATLPPSPSKRDHRRKRRWSSSGEVLAGGQDDHRQHRSEKQEGKKPHGYCLIHHMDAHDLANYYVVRGLLEKD